MKTRALETLGKWLVASALSAGLASSAWAGSILNGLVNMDNGFVAYLSTSDNVQGTSIGALNDWYTTKALTATSLTAGVDYYLHIYGYDQGGVAGFLGQFTLTGSDHKFANGSSTLLTNTTNWKVNNVGFNGSYVAASGYGNNGVGPWYSTYTGSISNSATWIWSSNNDAHNGAYFTTKISAVASAPEPATLALFGAGLGLLALRRRRN